MNYWPFLQLLATCDLSVRLVHCALGGTRCLSMISHFQLGRRAVLFTFPAFAPTPIWRSNHQNFWSEYPSISVRTSELAFGRQKCLSFKTPSRKLQQHARFLRVKTGFDNLGAVQRKVSEQQRWTLCIWQVHMTKGLSQNKEEAT